MTNSDVKEIETRINNRVRPHCGGNLNIELMNNKNDLITYKVIASCCDEFHNGASKIFNLEYNNLIQEKINNILRM